MNPIIQNYLNDKSVPEGKRRFAMSEIDSGVDESKIASGITKQYGDKYVPKDRKGSDGKEIPVSDFKKDDNPGILSRIKNAVTKTGSAFMDAQEKVGVGVEEMKGAKDRREIIYNAIQDAESRLASGEIDQEHYQKIVDKANELGGEALGTANRGLSNIVSGSVNTLFSPITGAVTGGFEPEMEKLGEKIGDNETAMKVIETIDRLSQEHPAAANYLSSLVEIAGIRGGGKIGKNLGKNAKSAALSAKNKIPVVARDTMNVFRGGTQGMANEFKPTLKELAKRSSKVSDDVIGTSRVGRNIKKAEKLLTPLATKKNLQIGARKGLTDLGEKGFFKGTKDAVQLSGRMKEAAKTLDKYIDLDKFKPEKVPVEIQNTISKIAEPMKEKFKKIEIPKNIKRSIESSWETLKKTQMKRHDARKFLTDMHKTFEEDYIKKMFKKLKDPSTGKFRKPNLNDLWEMRKSFDNQYESLIRAMDSLNPSPRTITQHQAFMEQRRVLTDMIESVADTVDDVEAGMAFREMSHLYSAEQQIINNITRTNASGESIVGGAIKENLKKALPYGIGATVGIGAMN